MSQEPTHLHISAYSAYSSLALPSKGWTQISVKISTVKSAPQIKLKWTDPLWSLRGCRPCWRSCLRSGLVCWGSAGRSPALRWSHPAGPSSPVSPPGAESAPSPAGTHAAAWNSQTAPPNTRSAAARPSILEKLTESMFFTVVMIETSCPKCLMPLKAPLQRVITGKWLQIYWLMPEKLF